MEAQSTRLSVSEAVGYARQAEAALHSQDGLSHLGVKTAGSNLLVIDEELDPDLPVARLSYVGQQEFLLSLLRLGGIWEPMPYPMSLDAIASELALALDATLARSAWRPAPTPFDTQPIPLDQLRTLLWNSIGCEEAAGR